MPTERTHDDRPPVTDAAAAIEALPPLEELASADGRLGVPAELAHSHLFFWITQVAGRRDRLLAQEFRPYGVRVAEWRVLLSVAVRPGISLKETAEHATVDPTTLTRTVDGMARSGWLTRSPDPADLRITRLELTPAGRGMLGRLWPVADRVNRQACAGLPDGAAQLMCHGLREVVRGLEQAPPPRP
ncbi:MarR family winged helix-turn-helix transcriptional regulator [Kitasatospora sp. NPDC094011]|uniref:MarR family winged helix-turn-helix transcriptional regulator n=1 Tax=Kitasatospora sp. NPDC094011 TaxID=3364090 RepID=UPI0038206A92